MEFDWYCTGVVGMKHQSCWGVLWFFKRPQVSLLEKQRNRQHDIWCLITNTLENRVAIFSSVFTRYLTLANTGRSPFNLQICLCSVHKLIIFVASFSAIVYQFISLSFIRFCSVQSGLVWFFSLILCSDTGIVFQVSRSLKLQTSTIWQVNKHHTVH